MKRTNKEDKYFSFNGRKFAINLERLKQVCLNSSMDGGSTKEIQISQSYEREDDGDWQAVSKLEHETKLIGNSQNDMIVYDIVKLMLINILENDINEDAYFSTLGTSLAINTLLSWGVLIEVE